MNLASAAARPPAGIAYPNFAGTPTAACSEPTPRLIELGPYEALIERTGTGRMEGSNAWLLSGFSMTSTCRFLLAETPAVLPVARKSADPIVTAPQAPRDQIRLIQATLGLSLSHLATVLKVERQTIYNWLQAEQPPALQARTRTRLAEIVDVSRKWTQRCPRPAGKLAAALDLGGGTLLDLLVQQPLDEAALRSAMDVLADYIEHARARRHERVRRLEPPPETSDDRILQAATGIPLNTDPDED
jgi:transcriptional regulator with XRE-family HTH domain